MAEASSFLPAGLEHLSIDARVAPVKERGELGIDQFFELMLAQLRHQDPLNPVGPDEFLSQVAQFSTVGGIKDMQTTIQELSTSLKSQQALQASTLVGRDVLVAGNQASLATGGGVHGAVDLHASTGELVVRVLDASGQMIRRIELGPQAPGVVAFTWDGLRADGTGAPPGTYRIEASAAVEGESQAMATLVRARVESVTLGSGGSDVTVNLGGLGPVRIADVREIH